MNFCDASDYIPVDMEDIYKAEVIWRASMTGAYQRARIFKGGKKDGGAAGPSDAAKAAVRSTIKRFLLEEVFRPFGKTELTEAQLYELIERLQALVESEHGDHLLHGRFRFGNAQKFVNLYLKYMWVCGFGKEPPHFPVDRVIQKKLPRACRCAWTNMDRGAYERVIAAAKEEAGNVSLAQWELRTYSITSHGDEL